MAPPGDVTCPEDGLLAQEWKALARAIGLSVTSPFELRLNSGAVVVVPVLLENFGADRGMLLVTRYETIEPYWREIVDAGFGFSTLSPSESNPPTRLEDVEEMLLDWGWSGPEASRPSWLR